MATRLYLSSTAASPISPAYSTYWTRIDANGGRNAALTSKDGSALSSGEASVPAGTTKMQRLHRQYNIALPSAVTISGTAKLVVAGWEVNAADNAAAQCIIRVIDADGTTVLATLFAGDTSSTTDTARELSVGGAATDQSLATVRVMDMALTSYAAPAGSSLSIEVGILQTYSGSITGRSGRLLLGAPNTTDQTAVDGTATPNNAPWIEFSTTLIPEIFTRTASLTGAGSFTATVVVPEIFTRTASLTGTGAFKARAMRTDWGPNLFGDPQYTGPGDPWWFGTTGTTTSLPSGVPLGYTSGAYIDGSIGNGGGVSMTTAGVQVRAGRPVIAGTWVRVVNDPGWTGHAQVELGMWSDNTTWTDEQYVGGTKVVQESDGWTWVELQAPNPASGHLWPSLEIGAYNATAGPAGGKVRVYTTGVEIRQQVDALVPAPLTGSGDFTATVAVPGMGITASLGGAGDFTATSVQVALRSASLTGSGTFTATSTQVAVVAADLAGTGSFAATSSSETGTQAVTAALTGAGSFTATAAAVVNVTEVVGDVQTATGAALDGTISAPARATLTVREPVVDQTPGTLTVGVSGVEPLTEVTFNIDDVAVATETSDVGGSITVLTLPVSRTFLGGTHILTATTATHAASAMFTVTKSPDQLPPVQAPDAPPVPVDGAMGDNGVYRWVLQDRAPGGIGSWIMPINPASMGNPQVRKTLATVTTTTVHGRPHVSEGASPVEWQFAGFAPDKAFQDKLLAYRDLRYRFYLIDHRNRAWVVSFVSVDLVPRKRVHDDQGRPSDWLADYTVQAVLYSQTPQEVLA